VECTNLRKVTLSGDISNIEYSFAWCPFFQDLYYGGTKAGWSKVEKGSLSGTTVVHCTDGDAPLDYKGAE
jgi:hypothetical protein